MTENTYAEELPLTLEEYLELYHQDYAYIRELLTADYYINYPKLEN